MHLGDGAHQLPLHERLHRNLLGFIHLHQHPVKPNRKQRFYPRSNEGKTENEVKKTDERYLWCPVLYRTINSGYRPARPRGVQTDEPTENQSEKASKICSCEPYRFGIESSTLKAVQGSIVGNKAPLLPCKQDKCAKRYKLINIFFVFSTGKSLKQREKQREKQRA